MDAVTEALFARVEDWHTRTIQEVVTGSRINARVIVIAVVGDDATCFYNGTADDAKLAMRATIATITGGPENER